MFLLLSITLLDNYRLMFFFRFINKHTYKTLDKRKSFRKARLLKTLTSIIIQFY